MSFKKIRLIILMIPLLLIINCCCTSKQIQDKESQVLKKIVNNNLSVGVVDLTCETQKIEIVDGKSFCLSKIIEIHGYGNSVKALSEGMEYNFEVSNNLMEKFDKTLIENKVIRCKIKKLPGSMNRTDPDKFKIISIEQK